MLEISQNFKSVRLQYNDFKNILGVLILLIYLFSFTPAIPIALLSLGTFSIVYKMLKDKIYYDVFNYQRVYGIHGGSLLQGCLQKPCPSLIKLMTRTTINSFTYFNTRNTRWCHTRHQSKF